jgi:hypothetical protein
MRTLRWNNTLHRFERAETLDAAEIGATNLTVSGDSGWIDDGSDDVNLTIKATAAPGNVQFIFDTDDGNGGAVQSTNLGAAIADALAHVFVGNRVYRRWRLRWVAAAGGLTGVTIDVDRR